MKTNSILPEISILSEEWENSRYAHYVIESLNDKQKGFIRHPPTDISINKISTIVFLCIASFQHGGNWYFWFNEARNFPNFSNRIFELLKISYQRVKFRLYYAMQYLEKDSILELLNKHQAKLDPDTITTVKDYVIPNEVNKYFDFVKNNSDENTKSKLASVLREIKQYWPESNIETEDKTKIFISYNHNDSENAYIIRDLLKREELDVVIDIDHLKYGDNIKDFIDKSTRNTDFTLSLISKNSLMSPWVILESLEAMIYEHVTQNKKYIPIIIDNEIFDYHFRTKARKKIENGILELIEFIYAESKKFISTSSLEKEKERLINLRNNMDKIYEKVKENLSIVILSHGDAKANISRLAREIKYRG